MKLNERIDKIMSNLPSSVEDLNYKYTSIHEVPYIQHIPSVVEETQLEFLKICGEVLKSDYYTTGKIHRQGIIGRYLDDCGINELSSTWHRFMCIDEEYREWQQPYYAYPDRLNDRETLCINESDPELISYFRDKKLDLILIESKLQKSIKNLIKVKEDKNILDDFSKQRYDEKFPREPRSYGYHYYDEFEIINEDKIRIHFKHGVGDYDYDDSFDVDMIPYFRDEKLNKI